ncbi:MAG: pyrrolidone-carboxylate peptidase [Desulfurococcaceae archaeon]
MDECTIVVSGFDWFRSSDGRIFYPNPSGVVAEILDNTFVDKCIVKGIVLPVDFKSLEVLNNLIKKYKPSIVIGLGLHPVADDPLIELSGFNYGYYRDNSFIFNDYLYNDSTLSIPIQINFRKLVYYLESIGYSIKLSNTSGLFLCNAVAYTIYKYSLEYGKPSVFIHIPPVGELRLRLGLFLNTKWSCSLLKNLVIDIIKYLMLEEIK